MAEINQIRNKNLESELNLQRIIKVVIVENDNELKDIPSLAVG